MKLRKRGIKNGDDAISMDELSRLALVKLKETIMADSLTAADRLPDVLVLDKADDGLESNKGLGGGASNDKKSKNKPVHLSSSLDPGPLPELYFDTGNPVVTLINSEDIRKQCCEEETVKPIKTKSKRVLQKQRKAEKQKVAGDSWFNMPATELTPEIKNDLKIIQIRNSLDRSRYYKSSDWKRNLPKYFQVGTVVEGSADYYSGRIPKKQRKQTIVEELLADKHFKRYHSHKYNELQKKRHEQTMLRKKLMNRRKKKAFIKK